MSVAFRSFRTVTLRRFRRFRRSESCHITLDMLDMLDMYIIHTDTGDTWCTPKRTAPTAPLRTWTWSTQRFTMSWTRGLDEASVPWFFLFLLSAFGIVGTFDLGGFTHVTHCGTHFTLFLKLLQTVFPLLLSQLAALKCVEVTSQSIKVPGRKRLQRSASKGQITYPQSSQLTWGWIWRQIELKVKVRILTLTRSLSFLLSVLVLVFSFSISLSSLLSLTNFCSHFHSSCIDEFCSSWQRLMRLMRLMLLSVLSLLSLLLVLSVSTALKLGNAHHALQNALCFTIKCVVKTCVDGINGIHIKVVKVIHMFVVSHSWSVQRLHFQHPWLLWVGWFGKLQRGCKAEGVVNVDIFEAVLVPRNFRNFLCLWCSFLPLRWQDGTLWWSRPFRRFGITSQLAFMLISRIRRRTLGLPIHFCHSSHSSYANHSFWSLFMFCIFFFALGWWSWTFRSFSWRVGLFRVGLLILQDLWIELAATTKRWKRW